MVGNAVSGSAELCAVSAAAFPAALRAGCSYHTIAFFFPPPLHFLWQSRRAAGGRILQSKGCCSTEKVAVWIFSV